jgi:hypothetical protein
MKENMPKDIEENLKSLLRVMKLKEGRAAESW